MSDTTKLYEELDEIVKQETALEHRKYDIRLELEVAAGRPDSLEAQFAKAALANDTDTMVAICARQRVDYYRDYGKWPNSSVDEAAKKLLAGGEQT